MKCPKCGKELKEEQLYCEDCGYEVQIVPDFEPEVEHEIHMTLAGVAEELTEQPKSEQKENEIQSNRVLNTFLKKHKLKITLAILIAGVFVMIFIFGIISLHFGSYEYQSAKAEKCAEMKDYNGAIKYMKNAAKSQEADANALVMLADYYYKNGEKNNAIITLMNCIDQFDKNQEAYKELIKLYKEDKKYQEINDLLQQCQDKEVLIQFQNYGAFPPDFSLKEESYNQAVLLTLSSNAAGTIYYTEDGTEPTKASKEYMEPIPLDSGSYEVKAIFVNDYGIESPVGEHTYYIESSTPEVPDVAPYSGVYNSPQMITVNNADDENRTTYFTIDGSTPTTKSDKYIGHVTMPLGTSQFKFITIGKDGEESEVTERIYDLKLTHVTINVQTAINLTVEFLFTNNYLSDTEGHITGREGRYIYTCTTAISHQNTTYYLITENYINPENEQSNTGNLLAVNAMTGEVCRAEIDKDGEINIISYGR